MSSKRLNSLYLSAALILLSNVLTIDCIERESDPIGANTTIAANTTDNGVSSEERLETSEPIEPPIRPRTHGRYGGPELSCNNETEVEANCTNSCPGSCEDPDKPACREHYCWRGCECKPGYVKEHQNWTCIPKESCPKCGENEHFRDCGTHCEPTCTNYQNTPPHCNSRYQCKRGCFCNYGYVRDMSKNGLCVPIDQCPQRCGPNEYFDESGPPCVRTADNPRPKCLDELPQPSCVCNTGFIRNPKTGRCERLSTFDEKCGGNETFSYCGTECAQKCFDQTKRHFCPTICLRGCFCNEGYVRDNHNERCVLPNDCYVWRPTNDI